MIREGSLSTWGLNRGLKEVGEHAVCVILGRAFQSVGTVRAEALYVEEMDSVQEWDGGGLRG